MKKLIAVAALALSTLVQADVISSIENIEGGEIIFTDIKNDQCRKGTVVISYGVSGRTLFGCWAPGSIDYKLEDGVMHMVVNAHVIWANGQKNTYPIKRQTARINPSTRKPLQGVTL